MNTMMFVRTACICLMVLAAVSGVDSAAPASSQLQAAAPHARAPARRLLAASFPPSDWRSLQFNIQTGQLFDMSVHRLPGVSTYIIDGMATPPATVAAMVQAGLQPLCYLRVGTAQDWASDYASFAAGDQGSALASDAQQFWVDVRSASVRTIMSARITACASAGYSAVVADFISDYGQTPGNSLGLTTSDYAAYLTWLSDTVTAAGMGFGAMDGPDVLNVPGVLDKLGFAVATGCASKSTCPMFAAIPAAGKPVFVWEEATDWPAGTNAFMVNVCAQHAALGLITILKGSSTSTRDLQSLPWVGCPPPFWAPVASQPPAFPPINWQTRVPPLALNLQPRQTFDLDAQRLTNVSAYVLSPWTNSAAAVYNMSAAGLFAICYASVGTAHNASSDWAAFQSVHLGNALPNGRERWVDVRADAVRASMFSRLALCASKGFTAVLLDNIYSTPATNGLGLSTADYTDYLTWVIDVVHGLGLTVGALDGGELLQGMSPLPGLDFGVTQECVRYSTCDQVKTVYANKPWFNVEFEEYHQNYSSFVTSVCSKEASGGFIASLKSRSLRSMPWASCSMAPSALQSGSTAVQPLVKVVNGELCMQGLPVMVNGTLRAPKEVSCSAGPKYLSILNGTLGLPDVEDELVLGPAMFAVHRSVDWLYDATLQSFTASVNVSGHLKMVLWDDFTQALATVSPVAVNLTGRLTFTSKDYPGPGFSGLYTWAGSLTITPDPYQALGLGPLAVSRRRHLLAAAAGDTHIDAGRQLLQASGEAAVDVTVQGSITAAEASTISPSTDADTARGDTNAWVEPSGAVKILERDTIPEALIPFWKKPAPGPPGLSATARLLIYVFAAITALMLGTLLGLAVYLHRLRKRQAARMAELQDVYGPGDDGASPQGYGSPDSPGYGPRGDYRPPSSTGPSPGPYAGEYDEQEGYARPQYRSSQEGAWDGRVRQASLLAEQEGRGAGGARRAYGQ